MNLDFSQSNKSTFQRFGKLGMWYILALSVIASVAIAGQVLIQRHLHAQLSDSRVVNIAGTQRYKSQRIAKMSLLLYYVDRGKIKEQATALEQLLEEWKRGHYGLQHGDNSLNLPDRNSEQVKVMFGELEPYFQKVYQSAKDIVKVKKELNPDSTILSRAMTELLVNEALFLEKMDHIVFQYDKEAREKVASLSKMEYLLLGISITVIILEILFIFRPTTLQVNRAIRQLMLAEKNARKLSKEIGALYTSLEKSYERISVVNQPKQNPRLYAKADKGGNVTYMDDAFVELTGSSVSGRSIRLSDLFPGMSNPDDWMDEIVAVLSDEGIWQGEIRFKNSKNSDLWVELIITPVYNDYQEVDEWIMMGADITARKTAEQNMNQRNRAAIDKKINQQKFRSVLILEGQEEERKRIAMDVHDGIGQMLTSLKFQIESIDLKDREKASKKIEEVDQLIREVIREVRRVTFNLNPTVLGDFGLQAALNVFVQEIGKLTDTRLVYNVTGEIERLPQKTENNIFRIIQEAINNALKYSNADTIYVGLQQFDDKLEITVQDEGKGFDPKIVELRNMNIDSGRGFFNMYERTEYINGTLTIDSAPGKGTTVTLKVPIRSMTPVEE